MFAIDFEYDGRHLSEYGFIICSFKSPSDADTVSAGGQLTFNSVPVNGGMNNYLVGTKYEDFIQTSFDICKNPDIFDDLEISDEEFLELSRWLNRREYHRLRFYDDEHNEKPRYYNGSFNIAKIKIAERLYGLELTLFTDKPYAYGNEESFLWNCTDTSEFSFLYDPSDDVGSFSPIVKITCMEDGDVTITNATFESSLTIKNCTKDEVIIIDGYTKIITSTNEKHDIWDDFNYEYLVIGNTINERRNKITASAKCLIEISFYPIIKDSP